jgi:hypothetical protein
MTNLIAMCALISDCMDIGYLGPAITRNADTSWMRYQNPSAGDCYCYIFRASASRSLESGVQPDIRLRRGLPWRERNWNFLYLLVSASIGNNVGDGQILVQRHDHAVSLRMASHPYRAAVCCALKCLRCWQRTLPSIVCTTRSLSILSAVHRCTCRAHM